MTILRFSVRIQKQQNQYADGKWFKKFKWFKWFHINLEQLEPLEQFEP